MLRQFYLGFSFFRYGLNWLDFLVVCSSWVELFAAGLPINPTFLRMLRLGKCLCSMRVKWFNHLGNGETSVFLKAGGDLKMDMDMDTVYCDRVYDDILYEYII